MIAAVVGIAIANAFARAPVAAGARASTPVALSAAPSRVMLEGSGRSRVRVTNSGRKRVVVDVSRAGFALDLRGRPRIAGRGDPRSAARWLTFRPKHLALGRRASGSLLVISKLPRRAEPGDHDALLLLTTRPLRSARVAVRVRMGVVVVVRAPGKIVRRLELRRLRVTRRGRLRSLDLVVANRGNVSESLTGVSAVLVRARGGRRIGTLVARSRDLRPRTRGILEFPFRRLLRGPVIAQIVIPAEPGRSAVRRMYRLRL